jgi:nitroreductase
MSPRLLHDDSLVHRIFDAADAATSIHGTRPWRFSVASPDVVELHFDLDRFLWIADPKGRALRISCGAALFNVRLALRESGYRALVSPSQDPAGSPTLVASIQLAPGAPPNAAEREMLRVLRARHPSRPPLPGRQAPEAGIVVMEQEAAHEGATLRVLAAWEATIVSHLITAAGDELAADREYCAEVAGWTGAPVSSPEPMAPRSAELHQHLAVLSTGWDRPEDWLRAGQSLQRVLVTAARYGLATSLLYQPIELQDIRHQDAWWPWPEWPQMIISCR